MSEIEELRERAKLLQQIVKLLQAINELENGEKWTDIDDLKEHLDLLQAINNLESDEKQADWTPIDDLKERLSLLQAINASETA